MTGGLLATIDPGALPWVLGLVLFAGLVAGTINAVVGSGTLISFPILLLIGVPPVAANISNCIGLVPGAAISVWEYRRTLAASKAMLIRLVPFTAVGALAGGLLVVLAPTSVFDAVVAVLIAIALITVLLQPWIQRIARARLTAGPPVPDAPVVGWRTSVILLLLGAYGGYFGAAQGVLLLVTLSVVLGGSFGQVNGLKNALAGTANFVGSLVFLVFAWHEIDWVAAALIALGSLAGGWVGARWAKRIPPLAYRIVVLAVGAVALVVSIVRLLPQ